MGSGGRFLIDLNEPPAEDDEENDRVFSSQPQKALPSANSHTSGLFVASAGPKKIANNNAFSHAPAVSGFQPFIRAKAALGQGVDAEQKVEDQDLRVASSASNLSNGEGKAVPLPIPDSESAPTDEREEGEWSDAEDSFGACAITTLNEEGKSSQGQGMSEMVETVTGIDARVRENSEDGSSSPDVLGSGQDQSDQKRDRTRYSEGSTAGGKSVDGQGEPCMLPTQREAKGTEASHATKSANNLGKRKMDQQKEAMLGKKRNRQTMFLNLEDVKQAGTLKTSTPRRQNPLIITRTVKEVRPVPSQAELGGEEQDQAVNKDLKQCEMLPCSEGGTSAEALEPKPECNDDMNYGLLGRPRRLNDSADVSAEASQPILRHSSSKQSADTRQLKNSQFSNKKPAPAGQSSADPKLGMKKHPPPKKPTTTGNSFQDTSVERLIREVTNEKFWHHPEESELQCIPGQFESVEEYVRVFEPLLFEECRAQLYSTWEELTETGARDTHTMVRIRNVERRERGWYDVVVLPGNDCKWSFKEGDVAVLSTPRPGSVRGKRNHSSTIEGDEEPEVCARVAVTVRRHIPIDTRDPPGAILHFYVGDSYDSSSTDDDHILRKLMPKGIWYLTVLGSLATTQREYVALHAFCRLNSQMQSAILKPSAEHFPKYEHQTPTMPECFTQNFIDHLHRSFNGPQLAAIQWAAIHTAAGTSSSGMTKSPWPFTLVQGPPGTGKTHTVWGMLNVIHLVQYQHYYNSLLKKVAPESYKQGNDSNSDNVSMGSIDEVLQNMDQNLLRTLPKLCPKPRMLVCAPSNAATDELLSRVLDRGFIDGEMKVYRPDVARVGVDSQTRAAQAVSVERRTEQLLGKPREEVIGWMHSLRGREAVLAQQIATLQRELNAAAVAVRLQGSVGVDPDVLMARDQKRDALLQNLAAAVENRDKVLVEMSRLHILDSRFRPGCNFNLEEARASLEASFANEAEIVFTTVSSSGRKLFSRLTHGFDMVVIDEAAQASEVGVLPPLSLGAARCVLVGDPQQLPATVISKAAGTLMYSRSLFERFQQAGCRTMLLSVQYRMHPHIRDFPSKHFYQGRLTDSESVINLPDEFYHKDPLLRPYVFYDVIHGRESHRGGSVSYQNIDEAKFGVCLYEHLQKTVKSMGLGKVTVGIITPYKLQLKCLQHEFRNVLASEEGKDIYINTVDAFQGQERDIIIMSCVRASSHGVGFVADIRRMNVALTRARRALWVMGNSGSLMLCEDWAAMIADAKARNCYMDMDSIPKEFLTALAARASGYGPLRGKIPHNARGFRSAAPRNRSFDIRMESRSGTPSEDDEKVSGNGSYRPFKPPLENLDDFDQSGEKYRDAWQQGIQKKQSSGGVMTKRQF